MIGIPNILGRYSIEYIRDELCAPRLSKREEMNFVPPKYSYINKLIPVVLDLIQVEYNTWSALFRDAARNHNLLHHIDPTIPAPPLPDITLITSIDDDDTILWCRQDAVLLTWIYATISPYLLTLITGPKLSTTSAMDAWTRLRDVCQEYNTTLHKKKARFIHIIDLDEDNDDQGGDLISGLPDDVLIYMLYLTHDMKTAGRTSILSKRWKHVWTHLMHLDFYDHETTATLKSPYYPQPEMDKFVEWVNRVICANRAPYLDTFRIHTCLGASYVAHIQNWLKFAFVKEVRNLELNFGPKITYPTIVFSNIFSTNPALIHNTTLKSLHLEGLIIKGPLLQWVLTNCLNLQRLSLLHCRGSAYGDAASSKHPQELVVSSLELKHLEFCNSLHSLNFGILRVFAPNLTSFIFLEGHEFDVQYRSIPSLVDATFSGLYLPHLDTLSAISSQLEKLSVNWDKLRSTSSGFPTFVNLQQLEIVLYQRDDHLIISTSLIEACPLLHVFKLKLMYRDQLEGPRQILRHNAPRILAPDYGHEKAIRCHQQLKTVEYLGYAGCASAAELAICLAQHAPMLEKFIFYTRWPKLVGNPRENCTSDYGDRMSIVRGTIEPLVERIQGRQSLVDVVII